LVRVLFLWNTAGAMTPVSDWLNDHGHESVIIMHKSYDPYGSTSCAKSARLPDTLPDFYSTIVREIASFRPHIIQVNSNVRILLIARAFAPFTPVVFMYHGSDVRGRKRIHPEVALLADKVIVSTRDLSRYGELYTCPTPKHFYYRGGRMKDTALLIISRSCPVDRTDDARRFCQEHGLDLTIVDCRKGEHVPHSEMPVFLSRFEYYLDLRGVNALSKTAMEALECGCKVVPEDMSGVLTSYKKTTPEDYLRLYLSMKRPSLLLTPIRLAVALPWSYWLMLRAR